MLEQSASNYWVIGGGWNGPGMRLHPLDQVSFTPADAVFTNPEGRWKLSSRDIPIDARPTKTGSLFDVASAQVTVGHFGYLQFWIANVGDGWRGLAVVLLTLQL